jgi:two-component system NtrC family sensor kinase
MSLDPDPVNQVNPANNPLRSTGSSSPASLSDLSAEERTRSSVHILVVEDNLETASMIHILLERDGYEVIELNSGVEALELIAAVERGQEPPFDVALLDIMMPYVNGYEVCQEIRRTGQLGYIPIIMVTALSSTEDMIRGLDLGADDYLIKPFNPRELLARVRSAMRVRDADRAMRRRNWHLAVLNALNDAINESLDVNEALQAGLGHLIQRLDLAYAAAFVLDRNTGNITRVLHHDGDHWVENQVIDPASLIDGSDGETWQARSAYQLALDVVTTGRLRFQAEAHGWPAVSGVQGPSQGWRACVPLKTKSPDGSEQAYTEASPDSNKPGRAVESTRRVLGALLVGAAADKPAIDLDLLMAIGNQIGQALEKHHFYQQAQNRSEELAALYTISQAVNSTLELNAILTTAMESIGQIVPVEAGSLLLLDDLTQPLATTNKQRLTFVRTMREQDAFLVSRTVDVDQGIVGQVIQSGQSLIVNDVGTYPHFYSEFDQITDFVTRSVLCVPLRVRDQVVGVIELVNKLNGLFDEWDLELVSSMATSVAVAMENGRLFHDLSVAYTDLENSQQAILASRNRLQALFDSILDIIYVVDGDYRITALNAALSQWLADRSKQPEKWQHVSFSGVENLPESAMEQICYQMLYGRESSCLGCQMAQALHSGERAQWTDHRRWPGGSREEWEMSAYPIQGWKEGTSLVMVMARDVTEQRMLEASLSQSEKLASLGELAAGLAHEINNPLTAIVTNAQLLLMDTLPQDASYESLNLIKQASDRAVKVVRNLLDFARQEQYEFRPTDLNSTLRAALELVRHQFLMARVNVFEDLAADLPAALVSRDHLQGVWLNLLLNARDAVTQGTGTADERCIWVSSCLQDDGLLAVTIRDNGVGISPTQLNRIFEPFFTTKDPGKGTGLGLSTSYNIIKQHGGEIQVDSEVGAGTTFTVVFPAAAQ